MKVLIDIKGKQSFHELLLIDCTRKFFTAVRCSIENLFGFGLLPGEELLNLIEALIHYLLELVAAFLKRLSPLLDNLLPFFRKRPRPRFKERGERPFGLVLKHGDPAEGIVESGPLKINSLFCSFVIQDIHICFTPSIMEFPPLRIGRKYAFPGPKSE
jgi:hypothetical protein